MDGDSNPPNRPKPSRGDHEGVQVLAAGREQAARRAVPAVCFDPSSGMSPLFALPFVIDLVDGAESVDGHGFSSGDYVAVRADGRVGEVCLQPLDPDRLRLGAALRIEHVGTLHEPEPPAVQRLEFRHRGTVKACAPGNQNGGQKALHTKHGFPLEY